MQQEPVDPLRLQARVQHYACKAGASHNSMQQMLDLLQSPLGQSILQLSTGGDPSLASFLVTDLYKVHMQSMYAQYMTGVTADFALNIRKCPSFTVTTSSNASSSNDEGISDGKDSNSNSSNNIAGHVLSDIRQHHPDMFRELTERVTQQLQSIEPLSAPVLEALQEFNGYTPPKVLLDRLRSHGVAPVEWVDVDGTLAAIGSGPIEAASNTETSVMQAIQAAIIAAAAADATAMAAAVDLAAPNTNTAAVNQHSSPTATHNSTSTDPQPTKAAHLTTAEAPSSPPSTAAAAAAAAVDGRDCGSVVLDRTERLGSSLGRLVWTVEQLNDIPHGASIMLMAGRRSTDLVHLLLQNLYFMQHVTGYVGTSSLLAAAILRQLLVQSGVGLAKRRALVGRVMGTHAHEMTSMVQQLMAGFDAEAGRRCGLQAPVCISQLLAHIVFLTANGGSTKGSSSHSDHSTNTTTTSTEAPGASHQQPATTATHSHGNTSSSDSINSDNSGNTSRGSQFVCGTALPDTFTTPYFLRLSELTDPPAEFIEDMKEKWGVGIEPGTKVFDLFSVWRLDSGSYPDLAQLVYDTWIRRNLARKAAGLAQLPPLQLLHSNISSLDDIRDLTKLPAHIRPAMLGFGGLADGFMSFDAIPSDTPTSTTPSNPQTPSPPTAAAPPAHTEAALSQTEVTLPVCSLVMKAVQARLPGHLHTNSNSSRPAAADAPAGPTPSQPGTPSATPAAAPAATAVLASLRQASAVKLGDGGLSKAQTDPRLPPDVRQSVLDKMQAMVKAGGQLVDEHGPLLTEVLREAYVAVVRDGVLMAGQDPANLDVEASSEGGFCRSSLTAQ